jgi:hypothetical protein
VKSKSKYSQRLGLLAIGMLVAALGLQLYPLEAGAADGFANAAFAKAYATGGLGPTLWGTPGQAVNETYFNSKDGQRQVQYFDKGRMELTYPETQPNFVGNGKLVFEMVSGEMQVGDTIFWQYDGAEIPIAGGTTFAANPQAPSYRAFQSLVGANLSQIGKNVNLVLGQPEDEGYLLGIYSLTSDAALGSLVKNAAYIPESGHNIPDVFWNFLNQKNADSLPAFNWQTLFGLPITDSYWAKVRDGDKVQDILVQLFERRTLLYNPAAAPGAQVECGNVGRDYYRWRYEQPELPVIDKTITPPDTTSNARVTPAIGEAGASFIREAWGFQPNEPIDGYARLSPDGGVYELSYQADSDGKLIRPPFVTQPFSFPTMEYYYTLKGRSSGVTAIWHFKVIGSIRYTPAVEAAQPEDVPAGQQAIFAKKVLRVGDSVQVQASGFQPGEPIKAWVTTPLDRVSASADPTLRAAKDGSFKAVMDAPSTAVPGIYALTLYGTQSQNKAVAYFRMRTGTAVEFNPFWSLSVYSDTRPGVQTPTVDLRSLTQYRDQYRQQWLAAIISEAK